jgi:iodotyrosine deiodinase
MFASVPYSPVDPPADPLAAARAFHARMSGRRSVREFSDRPVSRATVEACVAAAGTAPSGANKQPWRFVAVCDPGLKRAIRLGAEEEERKFYAERATPEWLADLAPIGTDADKGFLETAPWLIAVFRRTRDDRPGRASDKVYYPVESVGIAVGFLLAAIHHAGLVALTHTPSPMTFLGTILDRPADERPFLLIPIGYPAEGCRVPAIERRPLGEILVVRGEAP